MRLHLVLLMILATGSAVTAATLDVPGTHGTIQAAVDAAAPGDTVQVAAGVYVEQVVITTPLVLQGAGRQQTLISTPGALPHSVGAAGYRAIVSVDDAGGLVTITDLTVDGLATAPASGRYVGILLHRGGGRIERVNVRDVRPTPLNASITGIGVLASLDDPAIGPALTLTDMRVTGFQKSGVAIVGREHEVALTRLEVDGGDLGAAAVPNGIELTTLTRPHLVDCTIRGINHTGGTFNDRTAIGLFASSCEDLEVDGLAITSCLTGIYLEGTGGLLVAPTVSAPAFSPLTAHGLISVGGPIVTAESELPAPRTTIAAPIATGRNGLQIYEVLVRDAVLDGEGRTRSRGIGLNTFSSLAQRLVLERARITGWQTGVHVREDLTLFGAVFGRFTGCLIADNATAGIDAATITPLDARGCRWGDPSGPYNAELNPEGLGDEVSASVLFDPWLTGNLAPLPLPQSISLADADGLSYTDTVTVEYLGGADERLYGFSARLSWDPAVVSEVDVAPPVRGAFDGAQWFFTQLGPSDVQVDAALGGAHPGIEQGPLFTVTFAAIGEPDGTASTLDLELIAARDNQNQPITGLSVDSGLLVVDLQAPQVTSVALINETLDHTDLYAKDGDLVAVVAEVTDGNADFSRGDIRGVGGPIYGAPYLLGAPDAYDGTTASWLARPVFTEPVGNGVRAFTVSAIDPAGNVSEAVEATITIDNLAPEPTGGVAVTGGHNEIAVGWDDATANDLNYRRTLVRANPWGDYPRFETPAPAFPGAADEGDSLYAGDESSTVVPYPADGTARDMMFVSVLVQDLAGNVSEVDEGSRGRALNYRLGDVAGEQPGTPGDGQLGLPDAERLAASLGRDLADAGFDPECDWAPADSLSDPLPVPDGRVDLDDLMLLAMRYDQAGEAVVPVEQICALDFVLIAPDTFAVVLTDTCGILKGVAISADPDGATWTVEPGALLAEQPAPWLLSQGRDGACEAYLAVLGPELGLVGHGELLRLVADQPADPGGVTLTARDLFNEPLSLIATSVAEPDLPASFQVAPPYPNPFNPRTTIQFDLPAAQDVRVEIFALDGRRVRRLLAGAMPAGRHTVPWLGRDDRGRTVASGTYVYRLQAGPWSATGKLGLVK